MSHRLTRRPSLTGEISRPVLAPFMRKNPGRWERAGVRGTGSIHPTFPTALRPSTAAASVAPQAALISALRMSPPLHADEPLPRGLQGAVESSQQLQAVRRMRMSMIVCATPCGGKSHYAQRMAAAYHLNSIVQQWDGSTAINPHDTLYLTHLNRSEFAAPSPRVVVPYDFAMATITGVKA